MRHRTVQDVITRDVVTVGEATPFKQIVDTLERNQVSGLPVVDADGLVVGVVSEVDLMRRGTRSRRGRRRTLRRTMPTVAGGLLTSPAITVSPQAGVDDAARLLVQHRIRRLPVVDATGRLLGIVSAKDLLRVFLRSDDDIERDVARNVFEHGLWVTVNPATVTIHVRDGVVTLGGVLERRSLIAPALAMTRQVDGVVDVIDRLDFAVDDTHAPTVSDIGMADEKWSVH